MSMKVDELLNSARDAITVKRVFGEPYEKDGVTLIPAAWLIGGAGGGSGQDEKGQEGGGGGFQIHGRPAGAFVIRDGKVAWVPAVDPARLLGTIGLVVAGALVAYAKVAKARALAAGPR
jgi:uncharacterized spore protein YtfJ